MAVSQQELLDAVRGATAGFQAELANRDQVLSHMQIRYDQQLAAANQAAQQASQQASASAASSAATPQQGMIDTRLIGRPDSFDGGNTWRDWSTV